MLAAATLLAPSAEAINPGDSGGPLVVAEASPQCGNGVVDEGEECDDGGTCVTGSVVGAPCAADTDCGAESECQPTGADGCAANCTMESAFTAVLDPSGNPPLSRTVLQTGVFSLPLTLAGRQVTYLGKPNPDGTVPVAVPASGMQLPPVKVTGLVCTCVRGVDTPAFGPGNSGSGEIGCGPEGLQDVNVRYTINHVIGTVGQGGFTEADCLAAGGTVENGSSAHPHLGVCNGPVLITRSGGPGGRGSALITNTTAFGQIPDGGTCNVETRTKLCSGGTNPGTNCTANASLCLGGGSCVPAKGPNGIPCDEDDPAVARGTPLSMLLTTGVSEAAVLNTEGQPGRNIDRESICGSDPCKTERRGTNFDCDRLLAGQTSTAALANAVATLDQLQVGDNVTSTLLTFQIAAGTPAPPTATATRTITPSPRHTATRTPTPRRIQISIGATTGGPGEAVPLTVSLSSSGVAVAATVNDVFFDAAALAIAPESCRVNSSIGKSLLATTISANQLRVFVRATQSLAPIPDAVLYTCIVRIAPSALPGAYQVATGTARAYDADGAPLPNVLGAAGTVNVSIVFGYCAGDCDDTRTVTVDELVRGVNIALGLLPVDESRAFDGDRDGTVTVEELVEAVNNALAGCGD